MSVAAITDQRQKKIERYKLILTTILASNDFTQATKFIDHILSDDELGRLDAEAQKEIRHYILNQIQPRVVSFEEQVLIIREKLAALYESEHQWSRAAQMLSGIDLAALYESEHQWSRAAQMLSGIDLDSSMRSLLQSE